METSSKVSHSSISPSTMHIAILDTDTPVPTVLSKRGLYSDIFTSLLQSASTRLSTSKSYPTITTTAYDVVSGHYPSSDALSSGSISGILITGSAASSYYSNSWVVELDAWITQIYANYPQIKIFGSCFGHQIVCQSLLRNYGVKVEKDGKGWEVGVQEIELAQEFVRAFPGMQEIDDGNVGEQKEGEVKQLPTPKDTPVASPSPTPSLDSSPSSASSSSSSSLRLQFVHADHVVVAPSSTSFPDDWLIVGSTPHCACQGVYQPSRVLTYQGHFEFDRFVNAETVKVFGKLAGWDDGRLGCALESIDADDDSLRAAEMVVEFFVRG